MTAHPESNKPRVPSVGEVWLLDGTTRVRIRALHDGMAEATVEYEMPPLRAILFLDMFDWEQRAVRVDDKERGR